VAVAVYSVVLAAGQTAQDGDVLVYTAPATGVVVVRDVVLLTATLDVEFVYLYVTSGSARSYILSQPAPVRALTYHWQGRQVLEPGDGLRVYDDAAVLFYRISGYLLGG
jgi:hypothetical protein